MPIKEHWPCSWNPPVKQHLSPTQLFSVSFVFYQGLVFNVGTIITLHVRDGRARDLYNGRISSLLMYLKLRALNPSILLDVLQLLSVCFATCGHWWWWFLDPAVHLFSQLWIWHIIVTRHFVVSDLCHSTDINIEIHLSLIWTVYKFVNISYSHVIRVSSSLAKFGIICKFRYFAGNIGIQIIYINYIRNNSGPIHYRVVHLV